MGIFSADFIEITSFCNNLGEYLLFSTNLVDLGLEMVRFQNRYVVHVPKQVIAAP